MTAAANWPEAAASSSSSSVASLLRRGSRRFTHARKFRLGARNDGRAALGKPAAAHGPLQRRAFAPVSADGCVAQPAGVAGASTAPSVRRAVIRIRTSGLMRRRRPGPVSGVRKGCSRAWSAQSAPPQRRALIGRAGHRHPPGRGDRPALAESRPGCRHDRGGLAAHSGALPVRLRRPCRLPAQA